MSFGRCGDLARKLDEPVGGKSVDLPKYGNVQWRVGDKLDQPSGFQVLSHKLDRIHAPSHAGKAGLDKALRRRQPVGRTGEVISERLTYPPALKPVLLIEGHCWRVENRLRCDAAGKMLGNKFRARCRVIAERAERNATTPLNRLFKAGDRRDHTPSP